MVLSTRRPGESFRFRVRFRVRARVGLGLTLNANFRLILHIKTKTHRTASYRGSEVTFIFSREVKDETGNLTGVTDRQVAVKRQTTTVTVKRKRLCTGNRT